MHTQQHNGYCRKIEMNLAFVLVNTDLGHDAAVADELRKIDEVKEVYGVYGVYDIIATVKAETMDKLKEIVTWDLRNLDNVRSTLTMIVVEEKK